MTSIAISRRIGSRWCCAWQVGVTLVALGLLLSIGWTLRLGPAGFVRALVVEVTADAVAAAVLAMASVTVLRTRRHRTQGLWLVLGVWAVVALVRGTVMVALQPQDVDRIVNSNISIPLWALVVVYLFATRDEIRSRTTALEAANDRLRAVREDTQRLLAEEQGRLSDAVSQGIAGEILQLRELVGRLSPTGDQVEISALADKLSAYSSDVVRQTSHQLRSGDLAIPGVSDDAVARRGRAPGLLAAYLLARLPIVIPTLLIMSKGVSVSVLRWDGGTLVTQVMVFGLMFVVAWTGRWAIERVTRRPSGVEFALSSVVIVAVALVAAWGFAIARGSQPDPELVPLPMIGLYVVGVFVTARIVAGAHLRWRTVNDELESANAQLTRANDELLGDLARTREQLADVLHGPVQGRLAAASMALRLHADAAQSGRAVDYASTVATTVTLLDRAISDIDRIGREQGSRWPSVDVGLAHLCQTWAGLLEVTWHLDDPWTRSPTLVDGIVDLASELVTNASRHGEARRVSIEVRAADERAVIITAIDDGRGPQPDSRAGAGLSTVERYAGTWTLARTADGRTRVELMLRDPNR